MKNEKLMSAAAALGWFGAYILISLIATVLPEGLDTAVTLLALWGLIFICAEKKSIPDVLAHGGIKKASPAVILIALFAGAGFNLFFSSVLPILPLPEQLVQSYADASARYEEPSVALLFSTVLLVPVLEETVFRGLIGARFMRFMPKWAAIPAAALLFAVMHGNLLWCAYAFISGLVLMWMYSRFASIIPCIAFHMAFNAANYFLPKIFG